MRSSRIAVLAIAAAATAAACTKPGDVPKCSPAASWNAPVERCTHPHRVAVQRDMIELRETVQFETGSARLHGKSKPLLDEVAVEMRRHPEIKKVQIEGHTDNTGASREHNQKLSEERADSVKTYLVGKGVASYRLTTKGYGQDKPIADNNTEKGRFKNRRVDFRIVER